MKSSALAPLAVVFLACFACVSYDAAPSRRSAELYVKNQRYTVGSDGKNNAVSLELEFVNLTNKAVCFDADEFSGNNVRGLRVYEGGTFLRPLPPETVFAYGQSGDGDAVINKIYLIPKHATISSWVSLHNMYEFDVTKDYAIEYTLPIIRCQALESGDIVFPPSPTLFVEGVAEFSDIAASKRFARELYAEWAREGEFVEMARYDLMYP